MKNKGITIFNAEEAAMLSGKKQLKGQCDIYQYNTKTQKLKPKTGRPPKHGLSGTPTYQSFKAAKSRCCNPNASQYADYGGRGIEFRFKDIREMVDEIGERPEGHTLDRINPNGNYEPGNVRWASPKVQAANRVPREIWSEKASRKLLVSTSENRQLWRNTSRAWNLSIEYFNKDELTSTELSELDGLLSNKTIPCSTWYKGEPFPKERKDVGYMLLPSLTQPGNFVVVRGGPFPIIEYTNLGPNKKPIPGIEGLQNFVTALNMDKKEIDFLRGIINTHNNTGMHGICYYRNPACFSVKTDVNLAPMEGRLMHFSVRLAHLEKNLSVRFLTSVELARLATLDQLDTILEYLLVIPDLQATEINGFGIENHHRAAVRMMLVNRAKEGLKTIVVAEHPEILGREIVSFFEHNYAMVPMDRFAPETHNLSAHKTFYAALDVPEGMTLPNRPLADLSEKL